MLAFRALHRFSRGDLVHPKVVVFMAGIPGAGKTTVINRRHPRKPSLLVLDLDAELSTHPRYDPADPDKLYFEGGTKVYEWADKRLEERYTAALQNESMRRIIVDGTGTNAERQERRMRAAREAGWFVKVLYVRVPVRTAIDRAKLRKRQVSPERIMYYQAKIDPALRATARHADEVETVDHSFDMAEHLAHMNAGTTTIFSS